MNAAYVATSLRGALRLARFDAGGMADLDLTISGLQRSFLTALLCLPIVGFFRLTQTDGGTDTEFVVVQAVGYAAGWVVFPLAMVPIALLLRLSRGYVPFIVANNWAVVWQTLLLVPAMVLMRSPTTAAYSAVAYFFALGIVIAYQWFVARTALQAPAVTAVGIVALQLTLDFTIAITTDYLASSDA